MLRMCMYLYFSFTEVRTQMEICEPYKERKADHRESSSV